MELSESVIFILYVKDQDKSREFYRKILCKNPVLDVPGMSEFELTGNSRLGLISERGIKTILGESVPNPENGNGIPRCEIYLYVSDPEEYLKRGVEAGAVLVSEVKLRELCEQAGYMADQDGHIIAFARKQ